MDLREILFAQFPAFFLLSLLFLIAHLRVRKHSAVKSVLWVLLFGAALAVSILFCFLGMQAQYWTVKTLFEPTFWSWLGLAIVVFVLVLRLVFKLLLNALCGYDRVIVTSIPGTTRDTVEESVTLGRHLLRLLDTAGIHETDDRIEKLGVERAVEAVRSAELAIFVCDRSRALNDADREAMRAAMDAPHSIAVLNKSDLPAVLQPSDLPFDYVVPVCAKTGEGLDLFEQALDLVFPEGTPCDGSILTNERQADAVLRAVKKEVCRFLIEMARLHPAEQ